DLPNVDVPLLELLRDWPGCATAVPRSDGVLQTVCARYGPDALMAADSLVAGGVRALQALFEVMEFDVVEPADWSPVAPGGVFADIDTPADAARLGLGPPG